MEGFEVPLTPWRVHATAARLYCAPLGSQPRDNYEAGEFAARVNSWSAYRTHRRDRRGQARRFPVLVESQGHVLCLLQTLQALQITLFNFSLDK